VIANLAPAVAPTLTTRAIAGLGGAMFGPDGDRLRSHDRSAGKSRGLPVSHAREREILCRFRTLAFSTEGHSHSGSKENFPVWNRLPRLYL
jgi:hypothetical protein